MQEPGTIDIPLRLLDWYRAMGVDAALGDDAIDWIARGAVKPGATFVLPQIERADTIAARSLTAPSRAPASAPTIGAVSPTGPPPIKAAGPPPPLRTFTAPTPEAAVAAARAAAAAAGTLDALGAALAAFEGCGLKATAKNLCFYRGAAAARLMVVGEAPGRDEDLAGQPFVGPAGELLDKMLAAIGLATADCHITNAVYWRPPGNRTPTPQEIDVCRPFIERQITLVAPDVVVLLGAIASKQLVDTGDNIMRARGRWHDLAIGAQTVRALVSLNPNYLLKSPTAKQQAWSDLLAVKAALAR